MSTNLPRQPQGYEGDIFPQQYSSDNTSTPRSGVGQDKGASSRDSTPSPQIAPHEQILRPRGMDRNTSRSQKRSTKRKTVHLTLWVKPVVKAELQRIAQQQTQQTGVTVSVSSIGAAFLEQALQQNLYVQHTALLEPIINKAIGKHLRSYSTRLAVLLVRSAFASEQTRSLVTNILTRQPGITQGVLQEILDGSSNAAKRNIKHISPQLSGLIDEVEQWMQEEGGGNK